VIVDILQYSKAE